MFLQLARNLNTGGFDSSCPTFLGSSLMENRENNSFTFLQGRIGRIFNTVIINAVEQPTGKLQRMVIGWVQELTDELAWGAQGQRKHPEQMSHSQRPFLVP